jgi:hypothetical protein
MEIIQLNVKSSFNDHARAEFVSGDGAATSETQLVGLHECPFGASARNALQRQSLLQRECGRSKFVSA